MKNFSNILQYVPKRFSMVLAGLLLLAIPAVMAAASWSPERPTFTTAVPADYVTFNSITDNPDEGDERAFFRAKDAANTNKGGFEDVQEVTDGQELLLRAYVHNNAAANLNLVAENTRVRFLIPTDSSTNLRSIAYISADNAQPRVVSDTIDLYSDRAFSLDYIAGSAVQYTNAVPSGITLSDNIVTDGGALVGYDKADGNVQGCFEYSSIVTIKVKVKMPDYKVSKTVRLAGETSNDWREEAKANVGDEVDFSIEFTNTGSTTLNDVVVRDELPKGLTMVPGSSKLYNANNNGTPVGNDSIVKNGINIGNYTVDSNAFVVFKATVNKEALAECGVNKITNLAFATAAELGRVNDGAQVVTDAGDCPEPEFTYQCTSLTAVQSATNRLSFAFTTKVNMSDDVSVNKYIYDFGVAGEDKVHTDKNQITKVYKDYGKYNVNVEVLFNVGDVQKSETCSTTVEVLKTPPPVTPPPVTPPPTELPNTGPAEILAGVSGLFGAGALSYGAMSLRSSRSGLRDKMLGKK